jgi:hypothetical protein
MAGMDAASAMAPIIIDIQNRRKIGTMVPAKD